MELEKIKITPEALERIFSILNENFGDIDVKVLSEDEIHYILATCIDASYRIGLIDGMGGNYQLTSDT